MREVQEGVQRTGVTAFAGLAHLIMVRAASRRDVEVATRRIMGQLMHLPERRQHRAHQQRERQDRVGDQAQAGGGAVAQAAGHGIRVSISAGVHYFEAEHADVRLRNRCRLAWRGRTGRRACNKVAKHPTL